MGNGDSKIVSKLTSEWLYAFQLLINCSSSNYCNWPFTLRASSLPLKVKFAFNSVWMKSNFPSKESKAKLRPIVVNRRQRQSRILTKTIFYIFTVSIPLKILGPLLCVFYLLSEIQGSKRLFGILNSVFKRKNSRIHGKYENFCWKPKYVPSN